MPIPSKIQTLLQWLQATRETEIACDECLASMAELLETELESRPVSEALCFTIYFLAPILFHHFFLYGT